LLINKAKTSDEIAHNITVVQAPGKIFTVSCWAQASQYIQEILAIRMPMAIIANIILKVMFSPCDKKGAKAESIASLNIHRPSMITIENVKISIKAAHIAVFFMKLRLSVYPWALFTPRITARKPLDALYIATIRLADNKPGDGRACNSDIKLLSVAAISGGKFSKNLVIVSKSCRFRKPNRDTKKTMNGKKDSRSL